MEQMTLKILIKNMIINITWLFPEQSSKRIENVRKIIKCGENNAIKQNYCGIFYRK